MFDDLVGFWFGMPLIVSHTRLLRVHSESQGGCIGDQYARTHELFVI